MKFGSYSTVHSSSTVHPAAPVLLHFTLLLFLLQFFVSSHFVLVIAFSFSFFGNFIYNEHLYKPQSVQTCNDFTSTIQRAGGSFLAASFPPILFHLPSPFSTAKHSSEDDNSEDGWLDLFLLNEEGYWATVLR